MSAGEQFVLSCSPLLCWRRKREPPESLRVPNSATLFSIHNNETRPEGAVTRALWDMHASRWHTHASSHKSPRCAVATQLNSYCTSCGERMWSWWKNCSHIFRREDDRHLNFYSNIMSIAPSEYVTIATRRNYLAVFTWQCHPFKGL